MQVFKAEDVRRLDALAKDFGIDGILLMDHAALALYDAITKYPATRIVIACGSGNNGGDGFALARLLAQQPAYEVVILCDVEKQAMSRDEAVFASIVEKLDIRWIQDHDKSRILHELHHADIIVDALFGTGLTREIEGWYAWLVEAMNSACAIRIAVDIPSGLHADHGEVLGCCVKAHETISFAQGKLGLYIKEGCAYCGSVSVHDIGIPRQLYETIKPSFTILDQTLFLKMLPKRMRDSHKGSYGKGLLIGGSAQMSGAIMFCAQAALRCGIGTMTMMVPRSVGNIIAGNIPEAMRIMMEDKNGEFVPCDIQKQLSQYDVIAIGNGMGRGEGAENLLQQVLQSDRPCILDGDGIFLVSRHKKALCRNAITILTPHPKEVSYLTGISIKEIKKNPSEALKMLEKECFGATIIMKDTKTMISAPNGWYLNVLGNDGLAKGGSGDVLCGLVLGWLAQTKDPERAACLAVYLHAYCAELLAKKQTTYTMLPSDLLEILPEALKNCIENA